MFSFHKPKIYRSNLGCCICKAKSSSSRFTDSKKYENEFEHCFRIKEQRSGEICNACVLLVKRWKKLSPDNKLIKHWHHVVDARAGPGTKLTSGRRYTGTSQHHQGNNNSNSSNQDSSSSSSNSSSSAAAALANNQQQQQQYSSNRGLDSRDQTGSGNGPLPLSSSQSANQSCSNGSQGGGRRSGSFSSSKAKAIDTNVSTFTFGEPIRRSYMTTESSFSVASSSLNKPQSALNSSAFESVIKRFRQRQQQQQLEAERRKLNKQQRLNRQQQHQQQQQQQQQQPSTSASDSANTPNNCDPKRLVKQNSEETNGSSGQEDDTNSRSIDQPNPNKRIKRSSESIGSICVDGLRVSSLLDSSLWRKEKICCGIIFRGLHNEVVVFPKLLKPCHWRVDRLKKRQHEPEMSGKQREVAVEDDELGSRQMDNLSPPPRATKSGSISSCDSNTSGTGSMEPTSDELATKYQPQNREQQQQQQQKALQPTNQPKPRRRGVNQKAQPAPEPKSANWSADDSKTLSLSSQPKRPRTTRSSRRQQQQQLQSLEANRKSGADTDSIISSSSSVLSLSAASSLEQKDSINVNKPTTVNSQRQHLQQQQQATPRSPTSSTSGGSSSSRLLLMSDEFGLEDDDDDDDDNIEDEEEEIEMEQDGLVLDDEEDEEVESNTDDASSSVESLAEVERKKSSGGAGNAVGAMG